ncbi:MAG: hypothetical protein A2X34_09240 [Elusimicrobia bacterium GWC2_51_8]|nr:MAG: hypothetical protein A2X33_01200 [Elusimicrobia bacterium GWA2_51_34]OGR60288.1 MAG: hypothetical protein A2X34_09240 [Elusimicrobia bacterium GWC2_51_8]OGR85890.1 MAG: hypothetical protein A2021_03365 [Elusimicrobia bacterium GWF2_52_66]
MFRKSAVALAIIAAVSTSVSAEINFDTPGKTSLQQEIANMEIPAPAAPQGKGLFSWMLGKSEAEWTIMVYVNSKNNLEQYGLLDMNEMEKIGSTDKVNVVVEMGRMSGYDSSDGNWVGTRRYLVTKDNDFSKVTSPVLQDLGKVDMGDYKSVIDFGKWAKAAYPAKKYMLVVWNHGSGWDKSVRAGVNKGISYDDETGNNITTPQLGMLLKEMGGVDVYGSDACLMQMPEVVYEIKDYATYVVGSEETEPGDGYTYNDMLAPLVAKPGMGAEEMGKVAVDAYSNHYEAQSGDYTQSLVKTAALGQFLTLMNDFASAMMAANEKTLVKTAISGSQSYAVSDNHDIAHFASLMAASTGNATVKAKADAVANYIKTALVAHNRASSGYSDSHGIAGYMPRYGFNRDYNELAWAAASQWDEFINWYQK